MIELLLVKQITDQLISMLSSIFLPLKSHSSAAYVSLKAPTQLV